MSNGVKFVMKFGDQYAVKNYCGEMSYDVLVGFTRSKWSDLYSHNMVFSYKVLEDGEGLLTDDDDVWHMMSLIAELSLDHIEISVNQKEGVLVNSGGSIFNPETQLAAIEHVTPLPIVSRSDARAVNVVPSQLLSCFWANLIKDVGQVFEGGAKEFRTALCKYAIEIGFEFQYIKNDRSRSAKKSRLTCDIIVELIVSDIRAKPDTVPKDIVRQTKTRYGVDISYFVAWRVVQAGRRHLFGDHSSSYAYLEAYFGEAGRTNPGSVFDVEVDETTVKFSRCFFAFGACLNGFKACRPIVCVDGTFLKGKHRDMLLSAISKDGDEGSFPVAFAVVSEKTVSNWDYFFRKLRMAIGNERVLTFISDRNHGILEGVSKIFPECAHSYCIVHLQRNLKDKFRGSSSSFRKSIVCQFNNCAYAATRDEFAANMEVFRNTRGARVNKFLSDLPYDNWACAHFVGSRYGEMTSNLAESWNSQINKYRGLPITEMVDAIHLLMLQMSMRKDTAAQWFTELCPLAEKHYDALVQEARTWIPRKASNSIFEVLSDPTVVVDIHNRSCSCRMWQISGFPCAHAACVLFKSSKEGYNFVDPYFRVSSYRQSYAQAIYPFSRPAADPHVRVVGPPAKRILSRGESVARRMRCSRCNQIGNHNKKTCARPV